jgi:hypothetical protein
VTNIFQKEREWTDMYFMFDINKEPEIKKVFDEYMSEMDVFKSRIQLLKKQIEKEADSNKETRKNFWKKVYAYAKERNLIPPECTEDWKMEFNDKTGHFFCSENEEDDLPDFIKRMLK